MYFQIIIIIKQYNFINVLPFSLVILFFLITYLSFLTIENLCYRFYIVNLLIIFKNLYSKLMIYFIIKLFVKLNHSIIILLYLRDYYFLYF
jgi:hypothetical protein